MRYLLGTWVPSLRSLATNPLVLAYLALSAVAGLVVTYWFNDTSSVKVRSGEGWAMLVDLVFSGPSLRHHPQLACTTLYLLRTPPPPRLVRSTRS